MDPLLVLVIAALTLLGCLGLYWVCSAGWSEPFDLPPPPEQHDDD